MRILFVFLFSFLLSAASAQLFRCVVAVDGSGTHSSLQEAIDACPDNEYSIIYLKNGRYDEQISIGSKTAASSKKLSIIGQHPDSVVITGNRARNTANGLSFEQVVTFQVYAPEFYMENVTIENTAGNTGMAEALYTGADRQTFKNCVIRSYQDTYRSKKGTRAYFESCTIEGAVDFIYAGGVIFFDRCTIRCIGHRGYITAPEDAAFTIPRLQTKVDKFLRLGFIFRECAITAAPGVPDGSFYLGRPWNSMAGSFYLNCILGPHINAKGWKEWNGNESSASFAEFGSKKPDGSAADVSQRVSWSFQLPADDVTNLFTTQGIYGRVSTTSPYTPELLVQAPAAPVSVGTDGTRLSWPAVADAAGYVVLKDNRLVGFTSSTSYEITGTDGVFTVRSVGVRGQQSAASGVTSLPAPENPVAVSQLNGRLVFGEAVTAALYTTDGKLIKSTPQLVHEFNTSDIAEGLYLLSMTTSEGISSTKKLNITHKPSI
ncbi:MAG: pectinesterase family protein [Bacteroidales bacterium]|nr:pectinesterase family protein [Bacteroidales bacterium]